MDNLIEKITPSNIDAERAVIGSMLLDKDAVSKVLEILFTESFYVPSHQVIFDSMKELYVRNSPIDIVTVSDSLQSRELLDDVGGYQYILDLSESVPTTANVEQYAKIVEEKHIRRELIKACNDIIKDSYDNSETIASLLDKAEREIMTIGQKRSTKDLIHIKDTLISNFNSIAETYNDGSKIDVLKSGVSTGISSLDEVISGLNPPDLLIIAARPAMGKMENVNNLIVTPNGKIRMGDINIGQKICGSEGNVYEVTGVFPHGQQDSYRVHFDDKTYVDCGLEHLWEVTTRADRKAGKDKFSVLSTEKLMKNVYLTNGRKNYAIKITQPVYFEAQEITLHPYVLGFYLGDGYKDESDSYLINESEKNDNQIPLIENNISMIKDKSKDKIKKYRPNIPPFFNSVIEALGLNNKKSLEKFIPKIYIYNSIQIRLEILRGLFDTDSVIKNETKDKIEYITTSYQLCEDILELVRSLGGKCFYQEKKGYYTKNPRKFVAQKYYIISLSLPNNVIALSKDKNLSSKINNKKYIVKIEHVGQAEMQCIRVNSPDNLYITEGYNLTHNTAFCLNIATNVALKEKAPVAIFSLEMNRDQIAQRILSAEAGISSYHMKNGNISEEMWDKLASAVSRLYGVPIYIDDSGNLTPMDMRAKVRRLKAQYKKLGVVIVDYLQLMEIGSNDGNRVNELSKITRSLKRLAMEMQVPVIALSQLSRKVEDRQNKRPQLSDLRESGCVTGDTLIINSLTGERKTILELVGQTSLKTFALDKSLKINSHNMSKVFYSGKKMVYEIKTRTGRRIKASANHPFLKISGWDRLDNLKVGDRIGVSRSINIIPEKNQMTDDELILLAHLLGDGCILPSQPYHYTSADMNNINLVKDVAERLFKIEARIVSQKNWYHVYLPSPYRLTRGKFHPITIWYKELGIDRVRSYDKVIPSNVFKNDNKKISLFLKHLWATDGNISSIISKSNRKNSVSIYYATSSQTMAYQVQHLLLRLGIIGSVKSVKSNKGYRDMYHVTLQGSANQIKFLSIVGCYGTRGQNIEHIIKELNLINPNLNYDVIPKEAWKFIIEPAKYESKIGWREFCEDLKMSYCGSTLFKHGISRERMSSIYKVLPQQKIRELSESDILWDEIISINEIGIEDVYDATVDNVHNFVANDFIVHNSIEQDADIVMFIYRDEYYNHDSAKTKTAEIIIAKHRNGPTATVELFFDADLTKFSGLERFS